MTAISYEQITVFSSSPLVILAKQHLTRLDFSACLDVCEQGAQTLEGHTLGEILRIRGFVKFLCEDPSMLEDFRQASQLVAGDPIPPLLESQLAVDSTTLFCSYNTEAGAMGQFRVALRKSKPFLQKLFTEEELDFLRLYEGDIYYFRGKFNQCTALLEPVYQRAQGYDTYFIAIIAGYNLLRCYVALGNLSRTEEILTQIIRYAAIEEQPRYRTLYHYIMGWVNCITGWMGETPRFLVDPDGVTYPVMDVRIQYISQGISEFSQYEGSVSTACRRLSPTYYAIKDIYDNIYNAMLQFKLGNRSYAAGILYEQYVLTHRNAIVNPFFEYGQQILPLLGYALHSPNTNFARRWVDNLRHMCTRYEESLRIIREDPALDGPVDEVFSQEEITILEKLAGSYTIAEISVVLDIPLGELKAQIRALYRKLGTHSRNEAVAKALGAQLIADGGQPAQSMGSS